jgi:hypothetical protein
MAGPFNGSESLRRLSPDDDVATDRYEVRGWRVVAAGDESAGDMAERLAERRSGGSDRRRHSRTDRRNRTRSH